LQYEAPPTAAAAGSGMIDCLQVKWMMYWVVYAFFVSAELIADLFIAW
jgi:TB2/DP1, HVA22 family